MRRSLYMILITEKLNQSSSGINLTKGGVDLKMAKEVLIALRLQLPIEPDDDASIELFKKYKKQRLLKWGKRQLKKYDEEIILVMKE